MNSFFKHNYIMIRLINLTFILLVFNLSLLGQENLYDCDKSRTFADYLYNTGQYELSLHELERISYFCSFDSASQLMMLKSYRKLKYFEKEELFFASQKNPLLSNLSLEYRDEYVRMLMEKQNYHAVKQLITDGFDFSQTPEHQLGTALLLQNWEEAYKLSLESKPENSYKLTGLQGIAVRSYSSKRKSPALAAIMSAILPGAGKAYCGYWGDGVISFLFSASTTFFAIRGFEKYGTQSVYPWIVGGLAFSYYSSNIYGGAASAKRYNSNLDHSFIHETEKILYSDY